MTFRSLPVGEEISLAKPGTFEALFFGLGADGTVGAKIVSMAMSYLGTRYRSGGASPSGFDCSGFTMYLYAQLGYSLPHSATAQYRNCGYAVAKADLQPGNGQIIHARYSVGKVMIDSLSASYYASRYVGAKRIA